MDSDLAREINLRIYEVARHFHLDDHAEFLCECGRADCGQAHVQMWTTDFADCVATEGALIVAPGHQPTGSEVIRERGAYLLIGDTPPRDA